MLGLTPEAAAALLIGLGLLLSGGLLLVLRTRRAAVTNPLGQFKVASDLDDPGGDLAVLLVAEGGRLVFVNDLLRNWLDLPGGAVPSLEYVAGRSRPSESLLDLCSTPGQKRLSLNGLLVDAASFRIPYPGQTVTAVALARPDLTGLVDAGSGEHPALRVLSELSLAMTSSPDLTKTVTAILESIEQVVPADIAEITIWNRSENVLIPFRLIGPPEIGRRIETPPDRYPVDDGPSGRLLRGRSAILLNPNGPEPGNGPGLEKPFPFRSYLGVPLLIGDDPIGTIELASLTGRVYTDRDLETLQLLANQASVALQHALTREDENRRVAELTGLANLAQVAGNLRDTGELFAQLVAGILPLFDVEVLGFLIYDENSRRLQAALPFTGIPDDFARLYATSLEPGSDAETIFASGQPVLSQNAAEDPQLIALDLAHLAQAAGLQDSVLVPLTAGGRSLGYLQAANKSDRSAHSAEELRLLSIVAGQSAAIIDNARLLEESRRRTRQAEALRRIAALASSVATLDEILTYSLTEIARLVGAEKAAVFLLNEDQSALFFHLPSVFGASSADFAGLLEIKTDDPVFARTATASQRARIFRRNSPELETEMVYKLVVGRLEAGSVISVPLIIRDRSVGELLFATGGENLFEPAEIEIAATAAGQIAGAIERTLDQDRTGEALRRRVDDLTTLTRISRELNTADDLAAALDRIYLEALTAAHADCGTVILFDPKADILQVDLFTGDDPASGGTLSKLEQSLIAGGEPHILADFDAGGAPPHPEVRSALLVPIEFESAPVGLIHLHARTADRFDPAAIERCRSLGIQAGSAIAGIRRREAETADQSVPTQRADLKDMEVRAGRVRAALELIHTINQQTSVEAVYEQIGSKLVSGMGFELGFVAIPTEQGAVLVSSAGKIPLHINPAVLLGQRNPLRQTLRTGEIFLAADLDAGGVETWRTSPLLEQLNAGSFICIPVGESGEAIRAAFMGIFSEPQPEFTENDLAVFGLLGRQIASTLRNLELLNRTEERLREVDVLLDFSRRLGSLDTGEIIRALAENARQVARTTQAVLVALWDENRSCLVPAFVSGYRDDEAMRAVRFAAGETLPGKVFSDGRIRRVGEVNIAVDYKLPYDELMKYQEATQGRVPIASLAAPIPSSSATIGVLILDSFTEPEAFTAEDEALVGSLARQTGLILENAQLLVEANRRAVQLAALTDVATTITSDLQVYRISASLLDHLSEVIPFDTGTFWFLKEDQLTVRAAQGFEDDEERVGLSVPVEDSRLLSDMVAQGRALHVPDIRSDPRFPALPEFERLSWLGIPLIAKGDVVGVIALEKTEANFYDSEHIQIATTFAGQAAVALENARLFEDSQQRTAELDERSQRLDLLNRLSSEFSSSLDTAHILRFTTRQIRETFACRIVSAVLIDPAGQAWLAAQSPARDGAYPKPFDDLPFRQLRESLGVLIVEDLSSNPGLASLPEVWEPSGQGAALALSLVTGDDLHGLLILHTDQRLGSSEIDLARTIANQVAVAVQNAQLFDRSRKLAEDLERRVEARTHELAIEHERTETLLGIITELSASLDMDIVLNRTLALINRITGAEQSTLIIANPADESLVRRASYGHDATLPETGETLPHDFDRRLADRVIRTREPALIDDARADPLWEAQHRSVIAIPLMLGAEALGALMLFHRESGVFTQHHLELIQAASKQVAVAVNNAHLYLLIRDQAERLGGMLRSQQIESSRLLAILESVVDGVIVTDSRGQVTVFNHAAEQILDLASKAVVGRSLDDFSELLGPPCRSWLDTIQAWSANPNSIETGDSFSEEIALDEVRVAAVNLAPVALPHEFLGTVSIFRDITHLIEVDRMKSEFVATVSHELRTPLTSIKGYVDILLMGAAGIVNPQQHEFLRVVQENTERLNILVSDLLEVSRIEAGKVFLERGSVDLVELAGEVVTDYRLRSQEEKKPMRIWVSSDWTPPAAHADPARLRQILDNLVGNAYNYTEADGEIEILFRPSVEFIEVVVRDTGVGVAPKDQPQIFDRFYRGDAPLVTSTAGTGLGLSIVRYLVELHGGTIRIESAGVPGEGSTFYFTVPKS
ncbi:MAG TPA: GAF domain-containing protein [Anaerolineales bacterium]|nr:GAF domain-containing protein [Anaerolineales bacterium]